MPDVTRESLLSGLLDALNERQAGSAIVVTDSLAEPAGSSAPLLLPGSRVHISLKKCPKEFVASVVSLAVLWGIGGVPGPREISAVVTSSAAGAFFANVTKLSPDQVNVANFVAKQAREGGLVSQKDVVNELGDHAGEVLEELEAAGVVVKIDGRWKVVF
jgi:hypothetical protein